MKTLKRIFVIIIILACLTVLFFIAFYNWEIVLSLVGYKLCEYIIKDVLKYW